MHLSFSKLTNYLQCPYRLVLLQTQPELEVFIPQVRGLYIHEYMERRLRRDINGEDVRLDDIVDTILENKRGQRFFRFDVRKAVQDIKHLDVWYEQLLAFCRKHHVVRCETEKEVRRSTGEYDVLGVIDVVAYTPTGAFIIDLKSSNKIGEYTPQQVVLYSWLLKGNDIAVDRGCLYFFKSDGTTEEKWFPFEENTKLLGWMLRLFNRIGTVLEYEMFEYLPPNTSQRTCHPNRCSVYYMCPHAHKQSLGLPYEY